jgi:hypothetical protein
MTKKLYQLIFMIMVFLTSGCVKETYDMNMLSKKMHLSPTMAVSAMKGDIKLSDLIKSNDTVIFGQDNFIKLIFKKDSAFLLEMPDFIYSKGSFAQLTATFEPATLNLDIEDVLSHITGTINISNPLIKMNYSNSFTDPIEVNLNVTGKRKDKTVDLNLAPFTLSYPVGGTPADVSDSYVADKNNSSLPELISMLPEEINFSGTAVMTTSVKKSLEDNYLFAGNRFTGSLEVEIPLEFRANNLQFTDTTENFMKTKSSDGDNPVKPEDFEFMRIDITAKNGFPLGVSVKLSLFNSSDNTIKSTVNASGILEPAPVDVNGKANGFTETSTSIEFSKEFFNSIDAADKIIFQFTMVTTGNGSKDVKIYSDYSLDFTAALVLKADINLK